MVLLAAAVLTTSCSGPEQSAGGPARLPAAGSTTDAQFRSLRTRPVPADPVRLRVPVAGVDAAVERLGKLPDGTVDVPKAWERVGWYAEGPRPGEPGPAVLLGHVDSRGGPAVFARLGSLRSGDLVDVLGSDDGSVRFRVERVERYRKARFPTEEVYLPTLRPELRLVTCGGDFDRRAGHYVDNVVVYARLLGSGP